MLWVWSSIKKVCLFFNACGGIMETTSFYTFTGLPGRSNKMLISCPVNPTQTVVFFQGDVQVGAIATIVDFN